MDTRKVTFKTFGQVSDGIAKRLLLKEPSLTAREAASMGHDLARALLRPFFDGGEVPTHFDMEPSAIHNMAEICREGLLGA